VAEILLENGSRYTKSMEIDRLLSPLGVKLQRWEVGEDPQLKILLDRSQLTDAEKEQVLVGLDRYFQILQQSAGYQARDLIVLHPGTPNLNELLAKFDRPHCHADDEVRYIVAGEGVFGFVMPDGSQLELTIHPEEYINVPAGTEHWFHLTPSATIKAVRYFTTTEGWIPEYTQTTVKSTFIG
jgi:1,2-dihydroxy-3-keto-5-methylthiopentene dioxygenase